MQDNSGPTGGERFQEALVSETTALQVTAIYLIGILGDLSENFEICLVGKLCQNPDVYVKIWNVVEVLNVFQVKKLLVLEIEQEVLAEHVADLCIAVF